eukprot:733161_1
MGGMRGVSSGSHATMLNHREPFSLLDSEDIVEVTVSDSILQLSGTVYNDTKVFKWSNTTSDGVLAKLNVNDSATVTALANNTEQRVSGKGPGNLFGVVERPENCTKSLCDYELRVRTPQALAYEISLQQYHALELETPRTVSTREMLFALDIIKEDLPIVIYIRALSRVRKLSVQFFNGDDPFNILLTKDNVAEGFAVLLQNSIGSRMFISIIADGDESVLDWYELYVDANYDIRDIFKWVVLMAMVILGTIFFALLIIALLRNPRIRLWYYRTIWGRNNADAASRREVNAIPLSTYTEDAAAGEDPDSCAICLDTFTTGDRVRTLPCDHIFHKTCIDMWLLERKKQCPLCWQNVETTRRDSREVLLDCDQ